MMNGTHRTWVPTTGRGRILRTHRLPCSSEAERGDFAAASTMRILNKNKLLHGKLRARAVLK